MLRCKPSPIVCIGFIILAGLTILSGCTAPVPGPGESTLSPTLTTQPEPGVNASPLINFSPPGNIVSTSTLSTEIFSQTYAVLSGWKPVFIDPEEYGYHYFSPREEYSLDIDSSWPVNILVVDSLYADRLSLYLPEYGITSSRVPDRTVSYSYGFIYDCPLVVQEDNIMKKTVTFSVPRTGKYIVVIDPRFDAKATWDMYGESLSHEYFRTTLQLKKSGTISATNESLAPGAVNEVVGLSTNYLGTTKVYALDEYGYPSLSPGDSVHLSVSTSRPVNILVLDGEAMEAFSRVYPVEITVTNRTIEADHRGYSYGEISPNNGEVYHEDMSLDTEAFVAIPKLSKYYVVIDPRYSGELSSMGGYPSSYTEDFVTTKVYIEVLREGSALYWKKVGDFSLRKGEYEAAESYYRKSLALDSENPDTWYNLGIVLRDLGEYREAIDAFNQTLRIQPGDPDVWEKIGVLYLLIENEAAAREAYNRSLIP
jgi:hypothetical protein